MCQPRGLIRSPRQPMEGCSPEWIIAATRWPGQTNVWRRVCLFCMPRQDAGVDGGATPRTLARNLLPRWCDTQMTHWRGRKFDSNRKLWYLVCRFEECSLIDWAKTSLGTVGSITSRLEKSYRTNRHSQDHYCANNFSWIRLKTSARFVNFGTKSTCTVRNILSARKYQNCELKTVK